jgi:hypothetical protein
MIKIDSALEEDTRISKLEALNILFGRYQSQRRLEVVRVPR